MPHFFRYSTAHLLFWGGICSFVFTFLIAVPYNFFFFFYKETNPLEASQIQQSKANKQQTRYSTATDNKPSYMQSKCIRVLTIGGETPLHKWLTLLQRANLARSWATLLKSLFTCRICQPAKPSRRFTIPFTMWPKLPL